MIDYFHYFITWTTYGTWLPGDLRGWSARRKGHQLPNSLLERWCRDQMKDDAVLLSSNDRATVEQACREHCAHRNWPLHAVSVRTNHVHVVLSSDVEPRKVCSQLKANCTRHLRVQGSPLVRERTWTRGSDIEFIASDDDLEMAVLYVLEAQDRKSHD